MKNIKKSYILTAFILTFLSIPFISKAEFNPANFIDPFCLFSCKDPQPAVVNNTNSNNINSNINSPNSTVVSGTTDTTPIYVYDNNSNNTSPLGVSCYANYSSVGVGDSVTWRASTYGGNGNYHISWSGTNGLSGTGSSATITYNSPGNKTASVTVTSGGQTTSQNCSSIEVYSNSNNYNNGNYNNNDYYNNNYYSSGPLGVSCYPTYSSTNVGDIVTWRASAYGGNGNYFYFWDGTNGFSGTGSNIEKSYNTLGTKYASVRVTSGSQTITQSCGSIEVYDYNHNYNYNYDNSNYYGNNYYTDLSVTCSANTSFALMGSRVTWQAYVTGGNGFYQYTWSGTDSIFGNSRSIDFLYNSPGIKTAYITVRSNNRTVSQTCSNSVTVGAPTSYVNPYSVAPVYTAPAPVVKYVAPAKVKKVVVEEKKAENPTSSVSSLLSLNNVPWGLVAIAVIVLLLAMIIYLIFNSKKI